jgi:hypothetical protein
MVTLLLGKTGMFSKVMVTSAEWATTALQELHSLSVSLAKEESIAPIIILRNTMAGSPSLLIRSAMPATSAAPRPPSLLLPDLMMPNGQPVPLKKQVKFSVRLLALAVNTLKLTSKAPKLRKLASSLTIPSVASAPRETTAD